jgi:hypothetical protein
MEWNEESHGIEGSGRKLRRRIRRVSPPGPGRWSRRVGKVYGREVLDMRNLLLQNVLIGCSLSSSSSFAPAITAGERANGNAACICAPVSPDAGYSCCLSIPEKRRRRKGRYIMCTKEKGGEKKKEKKKKKRDESKIRRKYKKKTRIEYVYRD